MQIYILFYVSKQAAGIIQCILIIDDKIEQLYNAAQPDAISIEKLYFVNNVTTGIAVAEARGIILMRAQRHGIPVYEYTPLQVKQAVTGYGNAEKRQVQQMVKLLLRMDDIPKPDDAADAIACAITHCQTGVAKSQFRMK